MFSTIRTRALRAGATMLFARCWLPSRAFALHTAVLAADYPAPKEGTFVARNFRFHTGDVPARAQGRLRHHRRSLGRAGPDPARHHRLLGQHADTGIRRGAVRADQPLDARRYFIIIPDTIGVGRSSKPSDGLKGSFPRYNYADMVDAQYRW